MFNIQLVGGFECVAKWWLSRKEHLVLNMCTSATLWTIWKLGNGFCFQGTRWKDERMIKSKVARMLRRWTCLGKEGNLHHLEEIIVRLEASCREPLMIIWEEPLVPDAPHLPSWETRQPERVESSSSTGVLPSDRFTSSLSTAMLAVDIELMASAPSNTPELHVSN